MTAHTLSVQYSARGTNYSPLACSFTHRVQELRIANQNNVHILWHLQSFIFLLLIFHLLCAFPDAWTLHVGTAGTVGAGGLKPLDLSGELQLSS